MQTFQDTATGAVWAYEPDVIVTSTDGVYSFATAAGVPLDAPTTLQPYTPPPDPPPSLAQQAGAAIAAGLTIELSGSMTLAPTLFPTDPAAQGKLGAVVTVLTATYAFPGGGTSYPMRDATGTWHTFTAAQYTKVAGAIATYVAALDLIIDGNPDATALPEASVSLTV